jgi:hypothetical protein
LLSNVAVAFALLIANPVKGSIELPIPEIYKGDAQVTVHFVPLSDIPKYGGEAPKGKTKIGCLADDLKTLIMPNPCSWEGYDDVKSYARLMCHEKAHFNGWRH